MENDLTALLLGDAGISAQVGGRVHWMVQPLDSGGFPYVNLQLVAAPKGYTLDGEARLQRYRVQLDVWAQSMMAMLGAASPVQQLVSGWGVGSGDGLQAIMIQFVRDQRDDSLGAQQVLFRRQMDLEIWWRAAA